MARVDRGPAHRFVLFRRRFIPLLKLETVSSDAGVLIDIRVHYDGRSF